IPGREIDRFARQQRGYEANDLRETRLVVHISPKIVIKADQVEPPRLGKYPCKLPCRLPEEPTLPLEDRRIRELRNVQMHGPASRQNRGLCGDIRQASHVITC